MKEILVVRKEPNKEPEKILFTYREIIDLFGAICYPLPAEFPDEVFVGDNILIFGAPYGESRSLPLVTSIYKYDDIHSVKLYGVVYIVKRINHTYDFISLSEYEADTYCKLFCTDIVFEHWLSKNKGIVHYNIHWKLKVSLLYESLNTSKVNIGDITG